MVANTDAAFSRGDLMREVRELKDRVKALEVRTDLEAASIGRGGLAVKGGAIVIYDAQGVEQMRLSTDGLSLDGLLSVLGSLRLQGGTITILNNDGEVIFEAGPEGLTLAGVLSVLGSISLQGQLSVTGGGNVIVTDGQIEAHDGAGDAQVRMGPLTSESGQFGLEQLVSGTFVPLAALAGGAEAQDEPAEGTLTESAGSSTSYTDTLDDPGGGTTTGPSFSFTTYTGKWLILLIAHAGVSTDTAARMSYSTTGAQSISAADARSSLVTDPSTAMGIQNSAIYAKVHTGTPGEITVTAEYRCIPPPSDPPSNGVASWQSRAIIVIPY